MEIPKRKTMKNVATVDIRECVIVMLDSICIDRSWDQFAVCGCQVFYPKHLKHVAASHKDCGDCESSLSLQVYL